MVMVMVMVMGEAFRASAERVRERLLTRLRRRPSDPIRETAYLHYEATIKMLNDTMGLCLR